MSTGLCTLEAGHFLNQRQGSLKAHNSSSVIRANYTERQESKEQDKCIKGHDGNKKKGGGGGGGGRDKITVVNGCCG